MQAILQPQSSRRRFWFVAFSVYMLACLVMDLLPHYGPPHFRYTGSDPAIDVWNFGWPLAQFIYDSRSGLHVGHIAKPLIVLQIVVLAIGVTVTIFIGRQRSRRSNHGVVCQ